MVKGGVNVLQGSDLAVRMDGGRKAPVGSIGTLCIGSQGWGEAQVLLRSSCRSQVWIRCHRRVGRRRKEPRTEDTVSNSLGKSGQGRCKVG